MDKLILSIGYATVALILIMGFNLGIGIALFIALATNVIWRML